MEQLIVDGPRKYLQTLCEFVGIGLSDEDVDRYAEVRNRRMSHLRSPAGELMVDDRFFSIYAALKQEFGRERREAAIARIRELEAMLKAEHNAFVARIRELEASLDGERRAQANQIVEMQKTFAAEREAAIARIRELEAMLKAEHNAFVARIRELEQKGLKPALRRVLTRILHAVNKRGDEDSNFR